jgi:predicted acetyltransferase
MDITLRPITDDELVKFVEAEHTPFSEDVTAEDVESIRKIAEVDRSLAAFDGDQIVGSAGIFSFELTVPGDLQLPAAGVTAVSVMPTHRRRGILTRMMARQLDDVAAKGEPLAILGASESIIYGRFGYGACTFMTEVEIERTHTRMSHPPSAPGRLVMIDKDAAEKVLPACYDHVRRHTVGAVSRSDAWWKEVLSDREATRRGRSRRFIVVHERAPGEVDGFLTYRVQHHWTDGHAPASILHIGDFVTLDDEVKAALWQFAFSVDLIGTIRAFCPMDEPLAWRLADPRRLRTRNTGDMLWARILDVPAALAGRRYLASDRLVLQVDDAFRPASGGVFALDGGPDGAECARTDAEPDLVLGVSELGSLYLGGASFAMLARAGRVTERTQGALARADRMFASERAPWCDTDF